MPYLKSIPIRTTVKRSLEYILNPDKTDDLLYTTSLNCMTNAQDAYLNMKMVYEQFSRYKFNEQIPLNEKGRVKAIHYIQSFDPKDNVSPELAHRIAKAFARKTFGDDCQIVIATHLDKEHIHTHFLLNTYSLTGEKFNDNWTTRKKIREYSDRVCLAFGIQPIQKNKEQGKTIAYNEWENKKQGTSWKQKIRIEIDGLIGNVKNLDELLYELELKGYTVKKGKYISVRADGQQRFVRLKTLGEDYSEQSLVSRILWKDTGANISFDGKPAPIRDDYIRTIDEITLLARNGKKVKRRRDNTIPYSPENDMDIYKLSAQLSIINRDNIHSIGELEGKMERLKDEYERARRELNSLSANEDKIDNLIESTEMFYTLSDKDNLSVAEELKLNICRQTLMNNNISSHSDLDRLKIMQQETNKKIAALKNQFENCKQLYEVYGEITRTYAVISKRDYVKGVIENSKTKETKDKAL